jgi:hypothetical protein
MDEDHQENQSIKDTVLGYIGCDYLNGEKKRLHEQVQ